ncbi:MAG: TRAP transporter small permease subunit [Desulforegulaceae bacterium]|nr:TRAP transporter small permease subunit [Desulforegulaceae bacterium]
MEKLKKIFRFIEKCLTVFEEFTLFITVFAALLSLFLNVVLRYGYSYTLAWSEELVRLVIIYTTFIGSSVAVKKSQQVKIDAVIQFFPKTEKFFEFLSLAATMVMGVFLIKFGLDIMDLMSLTKQSTIILKIPMAFVYALLPLTGFLMILRAIGRFYRFFIIW